MSKLIKNSSQALYIQLVNSLINTIESEYQAGDKIPSEREICEEYDVSRTTVRQSLNELIRMGYIYKKHGLGTFVAGRNQNLNNLAESYSFTESMKNSGKNPSSQILAFNTQAASIHISQKIGINLGDEVTYIERLRLADDEAMMFEITYLPTIIFPNLNKEDISNQPMYEVFNKKFGQHIQVANEEITASLLTSEEAKILNSRRGDPCLKIERLSYNFTNDIIEYTISVARSDQFSYRLKFHRQ